MCLFPRLGDNPRYKPNKKNGGNIPPVIDNRVLVTPYKCGKCMECRKQTAREWNVRLQNEIKKPNTHCSMVTLTLSNEGYKEIYEHLKNKEYITVYKSRISDRTLQSHRILIEKDNDPWDDIQKGYKLDNAIATRAVRLFTERARKQFGTSLRHWLVTELGHKGTENIHMHGLIWYPAENIEIIEHLWKYGFIHKGKYNIRTGKYENYVNSNTINYCIKYIHKTDQDHKYYQPIVLTSNGIGDNYKSEPNQFKYEKTDETYRMPDGRKIALPKYYRNKAYTDDEKELLWIQTLNKNRRYVDKIEIDISKTDEIYYKILKLAQEKNNKLGYGDGKINWSRYDYEQTRREMLQRKRLK